jgi:hypothetical protein
MNTTQDAVKWSALCFSYFKEMRTGDCVGPTAGLDAVKNRKVSATAENRTLILRHTAHSLVTTRDERTRIHVIAKVR